MTQPTARDAALPTPVQRWSASDYAKNGRFVQEFAGPIFRLLGAKPGGGSSISAAATVR